MAYLYRHIRLDTNMPFYIGMATDELIFYKRSRKKSARSKLWNEIVSKTGYKVEVFLEGLSLDMAKTKEIEFIELYGRLSLGNGTLCNIHKGGVGSNPCSIERRLEIGKSMKGKVISSEHRKAISLAHLGKKHSLGKKNSKEHNEKIRKANLNKAAFACKVNESDVFNIIKKYQDGISQPCLAKEYNIGPSAICRIVNKKTWKHLWI